MHIQQQISSAPVRKFTPVKSKALATDNDSDDSDNDGEQLRGNEVPCNGHHKAMVGEHRRKANCHVMSFCYVFEQETLLSQCPFPPKRVDRYLRREAR